MMDFRRIDWQSLGASREKLARPFHAGYFAMYSSVFGGITTDPTLMLVPVDDHVVHRGDGVFETLKCVEGHLYNLPAHLERLLKSAERISLAPPCPEGDLCEAIIQTVRAGGRRDGLVRVLVTRGPGGLGVNPYECPASQLYIVVSELKPPFMKEHPAGARAMVSRVPAKPSFFATVKSCNYLPNVLMKKEAVDAGADFVIGRDEQGNLTEGATENIAVVMRNRALCVPRGEHILSGTTMKRVLELAADLVKSGLLSGIRSCDLSPADVAQAAELLIVGTTPDVASVVSLAGRPVGDGKPGPVQAALAKALADDIRHNPAMRTSVFA